MLRRLLTLSLVAVSLTAFTACSDSPTGSSSGIEGTYSLRTVNGQNVPVTVYQDGTERLDITGGNVVLNSNGTFTGKFDFRIFFGGVSTNHTETGAGTWSRSGNTVTFSSQGETTTATWNGSNELTAVETDEEFGTLVLVYRK
jgi:hypothetical protein